MWRAQLRLARSRPLSAGLHLAGVALAVAVLFATAITRHSTEQSLAQAERGLLGTPQGRLLGRGAIPASAYADLRRHWLSQWPGLSLQPVLKASVHIGGEEFTLEGRDLLSGGPALALAADLVARDAVALARRDAQRLGLQAGDRIDLGLGQRQYPLRIARVLALPPGRILADVSTTQRILERGDPPVFDAIDVHLPETGVNVQALRAALPPELEWVDPQLQRAGQRQLIEAFAFNLDALSVLTLAVAGLLLASTAQFSFRHRRVILERLGQLGATPAQLWRLLLGEALLLGALGSVLGWALGWLLSRILLPLAAGSVESLYGVERILAIPPDPAAYLWPAGLSVLLLAAVQGHQLWRWHHPRAGPSPRRALAVTSLLAAPVSLLWPGLEAAYVAVFATAAAMLLWLPDAMRAGLGALARLPWPGSPLVRIGWRDAARLPPHLTLAGAALCLALAASLAVNLMAGSLRDAVGDWLQQQLAADLYLQLPRAEDYPAAAQRWSEHPGVAAVSTRLRQQRPVGGYPVSVEGLSARAAAALPLLHCPRECLQHWRRGGLLVSEPLARRLQLRPGASVELAGRQWPVSAILRDFDPAGGSLVLPLEHYLDSGLQPRQASLGLWLHAGVDAAALTREARREGFSALDAGALQAQVNALFDRTFAVTDWLRLAVLCIALLAVAAGLSMQAQQQRRHLATLRALGAGPGATASWLTVQALGVSVAAALWALPLGYLLAWLLVAEINPRAFGWSLQLQAQPGLAAQLLPLALLAALLALPWPCWQLWRRPPLPEHEYD